MSARPSIRSDISLIEIGQRPNRFGLDGRHHVRIAVDGHNRVRVPEPLLDCLEIRSGLEHMSRVRVPKIMKPDAGEPGLLGKVQDPRVTDPGLSSPPSGLWKMKLEPVTFECHRVSARLCLRSAAAVSGNRSIARP